MTVSKVETNPSDFAAWAALHALIVDSFASMDGRIDPPSSIHKMSVDDILRKAAAEDLFLIREKGDPLACLFGALDGPGYYLSKWATRSDLRRQGFARALLAAAVDRARNLGTAHLTLQSRVELTENHATFRALGFREVGRSAHAGYKRATTLVFARSVSFPP